VIVITRSQLCARLASAAAEPPPVASRINGESKPMSSAHGSAARRTGLPISRSLSRRSTYDLNSPLTAPRLVDGRCGDHTVRAGYPLDARRQGLRRKPGNCGTRDVNGERCELDDAHRGGRSVFAELLQAPLRAPVGQQICMRAHVMSSRGCGLAGVTAPAVCAAQRA
jgi:hypothetical protein